MGPYDPIVVATMVGLLGAAVIGGIGSLIGRKRRGELSVRQERLVHGRVVRDKHLSPMFGNAISDWERVYTFKPVHTLDNGWVFCRYVWRRRIAKHSYLPGGTDFWFQYLVKLQYVYD